MLCCYTAAYSTAKMMGSDVAKAEAARSQPFGF